MILKLQSKLTLVIFFIRTYGNTFHYLNFYQGSIFWRFPPPQGGEKKSKIQKQGREIKRKEKGKKKKEEKMGKREKKGKKRKKKEFKINSIVTSQNSY